MNKPRIIIADVDINYMLPLQQKFIEDFFEQIELEIITEKDYYNYFFDTPQQAEILIVSEELYDASLQRHNINNIFLLTEQYEDIKTDAANVTRIFKYTSINEIVHQIRGKGGRIISGTVNNNPKIIVFYSACGGVGKTTVALGISACLARNYKRVLYINAERLQTFQCNLENKSSITATEVYAKLSADSTAAYGNIKHVIRKEIFHYLPPFKAALMSVGLKYEVYCKIAESARKSGDYDYVIVDVGATFGEEEAKLLNVADKVVVVTKQSYMTVYATNVLLSNINGSNSDKYLVVCNDFVKENENAIISSADNHKITISEYIDHFPHYEHMSVEDLSKESSMQRVSVLVS